MAIIKQFDISTGDAYAAGETRQFSITAEDNAIFSLEVKNEDGYYYNFFNNTFQANQVGLKNVMIKNNVYQGSITFPTVTDADQYDIYLWAEENTYHIPVEEVRFDDGSLDINSTIGSNSKLIQKVIYQTLPITLTLSAISINTLTPWGSVSVTNSEISTTVGKSSPKQPFKITTATAATKACRIDRQPTVHDVITSKSRTVGSAPEDIIGENIYPTTSDTDTVDGVIAATSSGAVKVVMDNNVASNIVVGDRVTTDKTTDTVNGDFSTEGGSSKIVMDHVCSTKMAIGDLITSPIVGAEINTRAHFVGALNPDGDNTSEFQMVDYGGDPAAMAIDDGATLTFSSFLNRNIVPVAALNPDGDNVKEFSITVPVVSPELYGIRDGATLNFSNQKNYRWPLTNINGLTQGDKLHVAGNAVAGNIADYVDSTTLREGLEDEERIIHRQINALDTLGQKSTRTVNGTTNLVTIAQPGNIILDTQQVLALAGDSIKFYGYGTNAALIEDDWDIEFTDLKVELTDSTFVSGTKPTTTTSGAVSASATIGVADREGIIQNISTISGIGIAPGVVNPTITSAQADGSGNWTASAAQTLESGITLTIDNTSRFAIITGNIEIKKAGNGSLTMSFDLEKFLTAN